jgi:putative aldouronate transport system permease protein
MPKTERDVRHGPGKKRTSKSLRKTYRWFYALLIPGIVYVIIFKYLPMIGLVMAFKDISIAEGMKGIFTAPFVGFKHYSRFFQSPNAVRLLRNTLWISFLNILFGFPLPIALAVMVSELKAKRFQKLAQTVSYLPHFISWVVASSLFVNLFTTSGGALATIMKSLGQTPVMILGNPKYFVQLIVSTNIWKEIGWNTIIYIAAITSVDSTLYEAAEIDGASRFQRIKYITLPSIAFIIAMTFILQCGYILDAGFEQIVLMYSEAVYEVGDIIDTYVYRVGLKQMEYSYATAVGLFKSVVSLAVVMAVNKVVKWMGFEGVW